MLKGEAIIDDMSDVESAMVWTDNPELEYFRSMMTKRNNAGDSLIGDSTLGDMLEYEKYEEHDRQMDSTILSSRKSPTSVALGDHNTSGLSQQYENDTVDNIYTDDEDSEVKMMGDMDEEGDEELSPAIATVFHPARQPYHQQEQQQKQQQQQQQLQQKQQQQPLQHRPIHQSNNKRDNDDDDDEDIVAAEPTSIPIPIPGFVFITDGPSNIYTWTTSMGENDFSSSSSKSPKKKVSTTIQRNKENDDDDNRKFICCISMTQIMAFLICVMIGASVFTAVIVTRSNTPPKSSSTSSSSSLAGFTNTSNLPTSNPSSIPEPNNTINTENPTLVPIEVPVLDSTLPLSASPTKSITSPPTYSPTKMITYSPTSLIIDDIAPTSFPPDFSTTIMPTVTARLPSLNPSTPPLLSDFPTSSSTTFSPTTQTLPVPPPSSCISSIATTNTCYENGDDIEISFTNCDATSLDWIGIYPASSLDLSDIPATPLTWLWSCGNQFCSDPVDGNGEATIFNVSGFGEFIILLLRDNADGEWGSFLAYGIGNTFRVSSSCN